jgi:peptide/nickel transport system permease protein
LSADLHSIEISEIRPRVSEFRRFLRVLFSRGLVIFGAVVILIFVVTCAIGPWIAPFAPDKNNPSISLSPPSTNHLLGTDHLGRDVLSRLIIGARISFMVGVAALAIAAIIGTAGGLIAGVFGGLISAIIMRTVDALMCCPMIILALFIASLLGNGLLNVMIALGIALVPGYARLVCGLVLSLKETDFIMAGRAIGISKLRLVLSHILPNCLPTLIILMTMNIGIAILSEAGLSYLGVGVTPPTPSWGSMVFDGYQYLRDNPLISFVPGMAILLVVFSFNMLGDGLRDALDPRLRGVI